MTAPDILTVALQAAIAGLSVLPPMMDGSKRPRPCWSDADGNQTWKPAQQQPADEGQIRRWYQEPGLTGLGLATGRVSGNLELFEFDDRSAYLLFTQAAKAAGLGGLVARIVAGYAEETPKPGIHWLYRCEEIGGNVKLASRLKTAEEMTHPKDREQVLIETRGEGGFVITAPSNGKVHPTGKAYRLLSGGFDSIATITPEERRDLFALARSLDQRPVAEPTSRPPAPAGGLRPGDDFNARAVWAELLKAQGWTFVYRRGDCDYWRRPGKRQGVSACTGWGGKDFFYCFSTSSEFEAAKPYDKFGFHVQTAFAGDLKAAVKALSEGGYGSREPDSGGKAGPGATRAVDPPPLDTGYLDALAADDGRSGNASRATPADPAGPPPFQRFTEADLANARLYPRCIVENYLYADLAMVAAAGGTGKTTAMIYEAVCIATGRDLWGCRVLHPGATLFITAEDSRDLFAARLREVMAAMQLSDYERRLTLERVVVWDVSGNLTRLAELDTGGNIVLTELPDAIVAAYQKEELAQVTFDPAISFGPGERIVNDGEQAVVTACRRIMRGLNCCVRLIHHSGKSNARNGAIDQYAGRGGTAMPDGCRMVTILSAVDRDNPIGNKPDGFDLAPGDSGFILARAKLSYCPPQPNLWIRRRGWTFEHFVEKRLGNNEKLASDADHIWQFLLDELTHGRRYTANTLEQSGRVDLTRKRHRAALANLETSGRVAERELPADEQRTRRKTYLHPLNLAADSGGIPPETAPVSPEERPIPPDEIMPPPYRDSRDGGINAALLPPVVSASPVINGGISAGLAGFTQNPEPNDTPAIPAAPSPVKTPLPPPKCVWDRWGDRLVMKCSAPEPNADGTGCANCGEVRP